MKGKQLTSTEINVTMYHPLRHALFATMVFGLAACGDGVLGPLNNTVFVLLTVDEVTLPALVSDGGDVPWTVIADTIWFDSGSDWRRRSVYRRGVLVDIETDGDVIRRDGRIILAFECPNGDCIEPDRLEPAGAQFDMEHTFVHAGMRLRFGPIQPRSK